MWINLYYLKRWMTYQIRKVWPNRRLNEVILKVSSGNCQESYFSKMLPGWTPCSVRRVIFRPSSRRQVTTGFGVPVARHRNRRSLFSFAVRRSAESSKSMISGGITTVMWPVCTKIVTNYHILPFVCSQRRFSDP